MEGSTTQSAYQVAASTAIAVSSLVGFMGVAPLPSLSAEQDCQAIGRVISSSNQNFQPGQLLCAGEPKITARLIIFCAATGQTQEVQPGMRLEEQGCPVGVALEKCTQVLCKRPRGGEDALVVTTPVGTALLKSPDQFSWLPSPAAARYLVQVEGEGVQWQTATSGTILRYPQDISPLQFGQTYRVTIIAIDSQGIPLASRTRPLMVLSQIQAQQVQATLQQLQQLKVSPDELAAIDLKALYLQWGLVDEAITALESRVTTGSQSVLVYQALGQLYVRVRNIPKARDAYRKAVELAQLQRLTEFQNLFETELKQLTVATELEPASHQ